MNYPSQLRGFAFDRAVSHIEAVGVKVSLEETISRAEKLAEFFYIPDKDWEDTGKHVLDMAETIDIDKLGAMIAHLSMIQERREAQEKRKAGNA